MGTEDSGLTLRGLVERLGGAGARERRASEHGSYAGKLG
jgi:hypothetical protein